MDGLAAVIAALAAFATGATGIIGALVTWRKAADEQTVRAARAADERMERLERSVDRLRVRERNPDQLRLSATAADTRPGRRSRPVA